MAATLPRALFLTALSVEYAAVREHLVDLQECLDSLGTVFEIGYFNGVKEKWRVCMTEVGVGNQTASVQAERAVAYFSPDVAMFVGIAGGIKDVRIGDVVAATKVYGYESARAVDTRFLPRPVVGISGYRLVQRARVCARQGQWVSRIKQGIPSTAPKALVSPIAAGEKVVVSTNSPLYRFLREQYSDAIAVEMEGIGFLTALHAHAVIGALIVRGISDLLADKDVTDAAGSQELASRHAAAFAFDVIADMSLGARRSDISRTQYSDSTEVQGEDLSERTGYANDAATSSIPVQLLRAEQIEQIVAVSTESGLVAGERRSLLLATLPKAYVFSLPVRANPVDQLRSDLLEMNSVLSLASFDRPPLVVWLHNAAKLAWPRPEASVFESWEHELRMMLFDRS